MSVQSELFPCALQAWNQHEQALVQWLLKQTRDRDLTHDIVQEVFIRMMRQQGAFCEVENSKAWLFRVAKNMLIDHARGRIFVPVDEDLEQEETHLDAVDLLAMSCLPRVLSELEQPDREVITACDLQGMNQQDYATLHGLSLPAVKSRLRRARAKLRSQIQISCQVKLDENQRVYCFIPRS